MRVGHHRGFTLWELMLTIGIAGVVVALGVPAFESLIADLELTADTNGLVAAVQLARSEAAKRRVSVVMCNSTDGDTCAPANSDYSSGWIVFVNDDDDDPPVRDPGEILLHDYRPSGAATVRSNRPYYEFRSFLRRSTNGTIRVCSPRGAAPDRRVIVSYTGRPRVAASVGAASCP